MIIDGPDSVTKAVLSEIEHAPDPRFREVMSALVRHLHAFIREVKLTEVEFQQAAAYVNAIGQNTQRVPQRGGADVGLARRVDAGVPAQQRQQRADRDHREPARSVLAARFAAHRERRLDRPLADAGPELFVTAHVKDPHGKPVAGAEVDIWQSSTEGLYENQDPTQADMNLRGKFTTDAQGNFSFRSILPAGYPIPINGPVGDLLRAQGRHNMRPAHLHFLIFKEGLKTHISQVYVPQDPHIETDVQFGVTKALLGDYVRHETGTPPAPGVKAPWYTLDYTFHMERGKAELPRAPIQDKARSVEMRPEFLASNRAK